MRLEIGFCALAVLLLAAGMPVPDGGTLIDGLCSSPRWGAKRRQANERNAAGAIKLLSAAQADFRANDRDGDGLPNFWKADVAGLFATTRRGDPSGAPIALIDPRLAAADAAPARRIASSRPWNGYWFRAILDPDETTPDPHRFAYCAFPDSPRDGDRIFIINQDNSVRSRLTRLPGGVPTYPTDDLIRAYWSHYG